MDSCIPEPQTAPYLTLPTRYRARGWEAEYRCCVDLCYGRRSPFERVDQVLGVQLQLLQPHFFQLFIF